MPLSSLCVGAVWLAGAFTDPDTGDYDVSQSTVIRSMKISRFLRLFKLLRILKGSRILARWEPMLDASHLGGCSSALRSTLKWLTAIILVVHWLACLWALLTQFASPVRLRLHQSDEMQLRILARMTEDPSCTGCLTGAAADQFRALASNGTIQSTSPTALADSACQAPCATSCELAVVSSFEDPALAGLWAMEENWLCRGEVQGLVPANKNSLR